MSFLSKKNVLVFISVLFLFVGFLFVRKKEIKQVEKEIEFKDTFEFVEEIEEDEQNETMMIDIKGEVKYPGVYEITQGTRVIDIIKEAGDFTSEADQNNINLSQILQDEMVVIVPKKGDEVTVTDFQGGSDGQKIRINQASKEEIETLNGIGPAKAQAIIDYREENGLFQKVEDLLEINGIGEKTLENFKDDIIIP
ncbi:helix-hairpin-helix domain-containing protein [Pseudogracilibacillus sp. SE30717A]|uniref:helix-hairpin-helix domain-containing protein n=1 Tax=Pseudogracilibacillus sp. SE30717A TaxID=3098293 RepID=UPI00300DF163